jgi:hypothetical protein
MPPWTPGTKVLVWQTIAWMAIDGLLLASDDRQWIVQLVESSCIAAQFATLAGWLALGDGRLPRRGSVVILAFFAAEWIAEIKFLAEGWQIEYGQPGAGAAAFTGALAMPLAVARFFGWRCRLPDDQTPARPALQFQIRHVLVLTLVVALGLGLYRILPGLADTLAGVAAAALVLGILSWGPWLGFLRPHLEVPIFLNIVILLGAFVVAASTAGREVGLAILAIMVHFAALTLNLYFFRAAGYRLVRQVAPPGDPSLDQNP